MRKKSFITPLCPNGRGRGKKGILWSLAIGTLFLASCSKGADCDESFSSSTQNAVLTSPSSESIGFATKIESDGSEKVQVSWSVVHGAGGYEYEVKDVTDPEAVVVTVPKDTLDGTSFLFTKAEDTNFEIHIRSLGNPRQNNKEAEKATIVNYSTIIPADIIPQGVDIVEFINSKLGDSSTEQAFELEAGGQYELNKPLDFGNRSITLRGNKKNRPVITYGAEGVIRTGNGLKIKFINFDCTAQAKPLRGVVECSIEGEPALEGPNFGYKDEGYVLQNPVLLQECWFKNVNFGLFHTGTTAWMVRDVRVMDCIVQLSCDGKTFGDGSVIGSYGASNYKNGTQVWRCGIRDITLKNSTFYNTKSNSKNRFFRFNNNNLGNTFGTKDGSATIENCTLIKVYDGKEFGNNTPNTKEYKISFNGNICYDVFRLQKFIQGNCTNTIDQTKNTICGITNPVDNTDKSKWATEENIAFEQTDLTKELDLTQPNGGLNLKPVSGSISTTIGDPRWLE